MNYLKEILAFEGWCETHYLPISSQLLWYKLMYKCNQNGWSEWVTVDNLKLMAAMQMGREATLIKARDELIKAGLIEYKKGKKGTPNRYRMVSLEKNTFKNVVQSEVKSVVQSEVYPVVESVDRKNKQKYKRKQNPLISPYERFGEFWQTYPKKMNLLQAQGEYVYLLQTTPELTEELLITAAQNYAESCEILHTKEQYIKYPENWLKDSIWISYLPENYRKPEPEAEERREGQRQKLNNKFNHFQQNEYDFDQLERELLSN